MKTLLAAALCLLLPGKASASDDPPPPTLQTSPPHSEWLSCSNDAECTTTALSCHGWVAIARGHEQDMQQWYSRANSDLLSLVECDGPRQPQPVAVCASARCQLQQPASVPVRVGGLPDLDACAAVGTVVRLQPGSLLAVRAGPGTTFARRDALANGREFFMCAMSDDGQWHGVVYSEDPGVDCGVATPVPVEQDYAGPCRSGWVHDRWVMLVAG